MKLYSAKDARRVVHEVLLLVIAAATYLYIAAVIWRSHHWIAAFIFLSSLALLLCAWDSLRQMRREARWRKLVDRVGFYPRQGDTRL